MVVWIKSGKEVHTDYDDIKFRHDRQIKATAYWKSTGGGARIDIIFCMILASNF